MEDACSKNVLKRMHPNKDYNILLNKLISGTIKDDERWELDRASLDDPFLADALEGIYNNEVVRKPKLLLGDVSKSRQLTWFKPLMVAASLVLLLGFSFLMIRNMDNDTADVVAESSTQSLPETNSQQIVETVSDMADTTLEEENLELASSQKQKAPNKEIQNSIKDKESKPVSKKTESKKIIQSPTKEKAVKTESQVQEEELVIEEQVISNTDDNIMDMVEATPVDSIRKDRTQIPTIDGVPIINRNRISGHVYDEGGIPISQAVVKNESDTDSFLTDANGFFALELGDNDNIVLVKSKGFNPHAQAARPELDITLKRSQNQLSERPMLLVETMDAGELKLEYSKILDDGLRAPFSLCPQEQLTTKRIKMRISISDEGQLLSLDYLSNLSEDCQRTIEDKIIKLSLEGAFKGIKPVVFYYDYRF